jgi:hypothetical protein
VIAGVIGAIAFAAGATKKWILSPIGTAFGDLSPDGKVIVTALIVVGGAALLAFARAQHRSVVRATRTHIERDTTRSGATPAT